MVHSPVAPCGEPDAALTSSPPPLRCWSGCRTSSAVADRRVKTWDCAQRRGRSSHGRRISRPSWPPHRARAHQRQACLAGRRPAFCRSATSLPSERELAALLAVSRETVRGAIQTLAGRGIVEIAQGARTRVVSRKIDTLKIGVASPSAIDGYDLESVHGARLSGRARRRRGSRRADRRRDARAARAIARDPAADDARSRAFPDLRPRIPSRDLSLLRAILCSPTSSSTSTLSCSTTAAVAVSQPGAIEKSYRDHVAIYEALRAHDPEAVVAGVRPAYRPDLRHDLEILADEAEGEVDTIRPLTASSPAESVKAGSGPAMQRRKP